MHSAAFKIAGFEAFVISTNTFWEKEIKDEIEYNDEFRAGLFIFIVSFALLMLLQLSLRFFFWTLCQKEGTYIKNGSWHGLDVSYEGIGRDRCADFYTWYLLIYAHSSTRLCLHNYHIICMGCIYVHHNYVSVCVHFGRHWTSSGSANAKAIMDAVN